LNSDNIKIYIKFLSSNKSTFINNINYKRKKLFLRGTNALIEVKAQPQIHEQDLKKKYTN